MKTDLLSDQRPDGNLNPPVAPLRLCGEVLIPSLGISGPHVRPLTTSPGFSRPARLHIHFSPANRTTDLATCPPPRSVVFLPWEVTFSAVPRPPRLSSDFPPLTLCLIPTQTRLRMASSSVLPPCQTHVFIHSITCREGCDGHLPGTK